MEGFFYESRYSNSNQSGSIGFDKKIIVMEDIDCLGDIVKNRQLKAKEKSNDIDNTLSLEKAKNLSSIEMKKIIKDAVANELQVITLDDLLNLWDGVNETPGRIIIITSNCYEELDPALVRPGRIDITIGLKNASHHVIREMYQHFYNDPIDENQLLEIKADYFSPAEIINLYLNIRNDSSLFVKELIRLTHIKKEKQNVWLTN